MTLNRSREPPPGERPVGSGKIRPVKRFALVLVAALLASPLLAQSEEAEDAKPPVLALEEVEVSPENPGPQTLCRLAVTVANRSDQPVTALHFAVEVEGNELAVYENQLFMNHLPAGESTRVELYNFWTDETGRPAPTDGKLDVTVTLDEARYLEIGDDEGTEVWTLGEAVGGLPVSASATRPFGTPAKPRSQ